MNEKDEQEVTVSLAAAAAAPEISTEATVEGALPPFPQTMALHSLQCAFFKKKYFF